jgi:vacuolar-type H+-ATPase subunit D/Vma8
MSEKVKSGKFVSAAFKRSLEAFGGCLERLIHEVSELNERVGVLEQELVALADRLNALELRLGSVAAEVAFDKRVPDLEAEQHG